MVCSNMWETWESLTAQTKYDAEAFATGGLGQLMQGYILCLPARPSIRLAMSRLVYILFFVCTPLVSAPHACIAVYLAHTPPPHFTV